MKLKRFLAICLSVAIIICAMPLGAFEFKASADTEGYYTYKVSNGEATITYVDNSIGGNVTIPSTLGGYPVTSIGYEAFRQCSSLTNVTIPDGVTTLDMGAFLLCSNLTSITIPNSVTSIGHYAFAFCTSLTSITIPDSVTSINNELFDGCSSLTSVNIGNSVTSIGNVAFNDCKSLTSITIPDSVTSIYDSAFSGCSKLTNITIPDSVISISGSAFSCCTNLTSIDVSECNKFYTSVEGILFNKNKTILIVYPSGKTNKPYIFPDSVTSIGDFAFSYCSNLTSIIIPDSVTSIGKYAFSGCKNLTSITIGNSVTSIGQGAFNSCSSLTSVFYGGSEYDKKSIAISSYNTPLTTATWTYNSCVHNLSYVVCEPTCTRDGYTRWECSKCIYTEQTVWVNALNHNWVAYVVEPTCTTQGFTTYTCEKCGITENRDYVSALGHTFGDWVIERESTCTKTGNKHRTCSVCEFTEYEDIALLDHDFSDTFITDSQATCTTNGSKSRHCANCNAKTDVTVIPAYGHIFDSWKYESVPTCTVAGKIVCSCLLCKEQKIITIEPYGHNFSTEWTVDTNPDCENVGVKSHHCTRCDVVTDETEISALGHSYTAVVIAPDCTNQGYTEHTCTVCGDFYRTNVVEANGHAFTHYDAKNATCIASGHNAYDECTLCGFTTYKEIIATGHNYQPNGNGYLCTYCGSLIGGGESENHNYVKTIVKATTEQNGYTQYTCTDCGYYYRAEETEFVTGPKFTVSDSIVGAGKTFIVNLSISNNPGIYSFTLGIDYDAENLTLVEVRDSKNLGGELSSSKNKILWLNNTRQNSTYNGEICQLVFTASTYAIAQDYSISITYNEGNIINYSLEDIDFAIEKGVVTVENFTAGDLNGDGKVDNKDLVLMSEIFARNYTVYRAGKEHNDKNKIKHFNVFGKTAMHDLKNYDIVALGVTVSRVALDCNNDGVINNHDLLTMMKYLRGEEITIH